MSSREKMNQFVQKKSAIPTAPGSMENSAASERIRALLDSESFVEVNRFVKSRGLSFGFDREKAEGDGVVVGYGTIADRLVFVASQDPGVYAGSMGQMHAQKISGILRMAIQANAPFIGLYDSGGARIEEGILALEGLAEVLSCMNEAADSIPVFAAVLGPCPGASSLMAGLSHIRLMTATASGLYMNGPSVTAATEGRVLDPAEIGGAGVHAKRTGLATLVCADEKAVAAEIRNILGYFPDAPDEIAEADGAGDDPNRVEGRLDEIAENLDQGYDMGEIIRLVVDQNSFYELSPEYAPGVTTAFARLDGFSVGVVANRAARMDSAMAKKAASFTRLCDTFGIPVLSFVDCEGFAIGIESEHADIIQSAAGLFRAMDSCSVPRIGLLIGKAIGTAYLTRASKQSGCDFVFAWPTSEIAIVSADTAANIIYRKEIALAKSPIAARAEFTEKYSREIASGDVAASLGQIDEVVMPSSTRPRLISSLQVLLS